MCAIYQTCLLVWFVCILRTKIWSIYIYIYIYENTKIMRGKKEWSEIFLDILCGSFVFRSRICPVLGFLCGTCLSLVTTHCHSFAFCIALSVASALNSGNSKPGLYFHCKVQAFTVFLEAMLNFFPQEQNFFSPTEKLMEKVPKRWGNRYKSEPGIVESSISETSAC